MMCPCVLQVLLKLTETRVCSCKECQWMVPGQRIMIVCHFCSLAIRVPRPLPAPSPPSPSPLSSCLPPPANPLPVVPSTGASWLASWQFSVKVIIRLRLTHTHTQMYAHNTRMSTWNLRTAPCMAADADGTQNPSGRRQNTHTKRLRSL